jgi:hypothetical protein
MVKKKIEYATCPQCGISVPNRQIGDGVCMACRGQRAMLASFDLPKAEDWIDKAAQEYCREYLPEGEKTWPTLAAVIRRHDPSGELFAALNMLVFNHADPTPADIKWATANAALDKYRKGC